MKINKVYKTMIEKGVTKNGKLTFSETLQNAKVFWVANFSANLPRKVFGSQIRFSVKVIKPETNSFRVALSKNIAKEVWRYATSDIISSMKKFLNKEITIHRDSNKIVLTSSGDEGLSIITRILRLTMNSIKERLHDEIIKDATETFLKMPCYSDGINVKIALKDGEFLIIVTPKKKSRNKKIGMTFKLSQFAEIKDFANRYPRLLG